MGCVDPNILLGAHFQMSFTSLLHEAKIVSPFLFMYGTAAALSSFNDTCSAVLFLQKAFKQKKTACMRNYVVSIFYALNFCHLICASLAFQNCTRKSRKIETWKSNWCKFIKNAFYPPF